MLHCPHCAAPITLTDLYSRRLLRPRTCKACGGQYFEGGTTVAIAIVGAGGGLATSLSSFKSFSPWLPLVVAFGFALLGIFYTHHHQPRKVDELRAKLIQAVIAGLVAAGVVGTLVRMLVAIAT
jgi:uncharacterized protein (DUF983 family)